VKEKETRRQRIERVHAKALARGAKCQRCPLALSKRGPVPSTVRKARLAIINEAPGFKEVLAMRPFVDKDGRELQRALTAADTTRDEVAILQVLECQPPGNGSIAGYERDINRLNAPAVEAHKVALAKYREAKKAAKKAKKDPPEKPTPPVLMKSPIECCSPRLRKDLMKVRPKVFMPLGQYAHKALAKVLDVPLGGDKKYRGEVRLAELSKQRGHPLPLPQYIKWNPDDVDALNDALEPEAKIRYYSSKLKIATANTLKLKSGAFILPSYPPRYAMMKAHHMAHRIRTDIARAATIAREGKLRWKDGKVKIAPTVSEIRKWAKNQIRLNRQQMVDIETGPRNRMEAKDGLHIDALVRCIIFTSGPEEKETTIVVPFFTKAGKQFWTPRNHKRVKFWCRKVLDSCPTAFHNGISFDRPRLLRQNYMTDNANSGFKANDDDLIIAMHDSREQDNEKNLGYVISCFFDMPLHKSDVDHKVAGSETEDEDLWIYGGRDGVTQSRCLRRVKKWIKEDKTEKQYRFDMEQLAPVITGMCMTPVPIFYPEMQTAITMLRGETNKYETRVRTAVKSLAPDVVWPAGKDKKHVFNPRSPKQVGQLLFDHLGHEPKLNTEGHPYSAGDGASTSIDALLALEDSGKVVGVTADLLDAFIRYKCMEKLRQMVEGISYEYAPHWGPEYRQLWVNWKMHVVPSGRLASSPNFQNWTSLGFYNMKKLIMAPPGHVIVSADGEQIEARVYAIQSGDQVMLRAFAEGLDVHAANAATLLAHNDEEELRLTHEIAQKKKETWTPTDQDKRDWQEMVELRRDAGDEKYRKVDIDRPSHEALVENNLKYAEEVRRIAKFYCIAEGQLVLTDRGDVPIEQVRDDDLVWDGIEWVAHDGVIYKGEQKVIEHDGLIATPDHKVWLEDGRKVEFGQAAAECAVLARGAEGGQPLWYVADQEQGVEGSRASQGDRRVQMRPAQGFVSRQPSSGKVEGMPLVREAEGHAARTSNVHGGGCAALQQSEESVFSALRRTWDRVSVRVERSWRALDFGQSRAEAGPKNGVGPNRQRRSLRTGESSVGNAFGKSTQSPNRADAQAELEFHVSGDGMAVRRIHCAGEDAGRQNTRTDFRRCAVGGDAQIKRMEADRAPIKGTRRVYDILNAGPRRRFTTSSCLVSNCYNKQYGDGDDLFSTMRRQRNKVTGKRVFPGLSEELVDTWNDRWDSRRPWTKQWHRKVARYVAAHGYNMTPFAGRIRHYLGGPNKKFAPPNHECQGGAGDLMNEALVGVNKDIPRGGWSPSSGIFGQTHDDIRVIVPESRAAEACGIVEKHMNRMVRVGNVDMPFLATAKSARCLADV